MQGIRLVQLNAVSVAKNISVGRGGRLVGSRGFGWACSIMVEHRSHTAGVPVRIRAGPLL